MRKVDHLLCFAREFLCGNSEAQISEKVIAAFRDDVVKFHGLTVAEYEQLFDSPLASEADASKFLKLNQKLIHDLEFLRQLSPRNRKGRKYYFLVGAAEEDEAFEPNSIVNSFEVLNSLFVQLDCQSREYLSACDQLRTLAQSSNTCQQLSRSFYEVMMDNYLLLNKTLLCNIEDQDFFTAVRPQINKVRNHLSELHKNSTFQYLRRLITSSKKVSKTLSEITRLCGCIYSEKLIAELEPKASELELQTETDRRKDSEFLLQNHNSVTFSKQFSRIKCKRPSVSMDSFSLLLPNLKEMTEGNTKNNSKGPDKNRYSDAPNIAPRSQKKTDDAGEIAHLSERCFCIIF